MTRTQYINEKAWLLCLVIHAVLVAALLSGRLDIFFNDAMHRLGPGTDFQTYYNAARYWLAGEGMYGHGPGFGYRYHPLFAAGVFGLLSNLPIKTAYAIWMLLSEACFLYGLRTLASLGRQEPWWYLFAIGYALFSPYYLELFSGNCTFIAAVLLIRAFKTYQNARYWLFSVLFLASLYVKPVGLVFLPYLLYRQQYRLCAVIGTVFALTALPFFMVDKQAWPTFVATNFSELVGRGWVIHAGNLGLHGLAADFFTRLEKIDIAQMNTLSVLSGFAQNILKLMPVCFGLSSLLVAWRVRHNMYLSLFLLGCAYLLGYKDIWEYSYVFVIPLLFWLLLAEVISARIVLTVFFILALPTPFVFYDVSLPPGPNDPERYWTTSTALLYHASKSIPLLAIYTLVCWHCIYKQAPAI